VKDLTPEISHFASMSAAGDLVISPALTAALSDIRKVLVTDFLPESDGF
jgi:hypothetical protein